jgi:hypothetical protein
MEWFWKGVFVLMLLYQFVMMWKREGMAQAILNLMGLVSFYFAFFNPLNNTVNDTIFLPALFIGFFSFAIAFILWLRVKKRKPK